MSLTSCKSSKRSNGAFGFKSGGNFDYLRRADSVRKIRASADLLVNTPTIPYHGRDFVAVSVCIGGVAFR